jgi:hypothetical protein
MGKPLSIVKKRIRRKRWIERKKAIVRQTKKGK